MDENGTLYDDYMKSRRWRQLRDRRLKLDDYKCVRCGSAKNLRVHHLHYPAVYGWEDVENDLVTLCDACHEAIHASEEAARTKRYEARRWTGRDVEWQFVQYAWPLDTTNGGDRNLADIKQLSEVRKMFVEQMGLPGGPPIMGFHENLVYLIDGKIARLMGEGKTPREISDELHISEQRIYRRLDIMKVKNWTEVNAAQPGGGAKLPAGGYVIRILKVEDDERNEYLTITYDIAEGEHAGHYADEDAGNAWRHQFRRYYSEKAEAFFAQFLQALAASNADFDLNAWSKVSNPYDLEGLVLGSIWQDVKYTNTKGEDKERLDFYAAVPADRIRAGQFEVPPVKDVRTKVDEPDVSAYTRDSSIPF